MGLLKVGDMDDVETLRDKAVWGYPWDGFRP